MSLRDLQQVFKDLLRRAGRERFQEGVEELLRLAENRSAAGYTSFLSCAEGDLKVLQALRAVSLSPGRDSSL